MNKISSFISEKLNNIKAVVTARDSREAESEDPITYRLMQEHLIIKNAHRVIAFSVFVLIAGVVTLFAGEHTALSIVGALFLVVPAVLFTWLLCRTSFSRLPDHKVIRIMTIIFWLLVTAGGIMISVSEQNAGKTPFFFYILAGCITAVPVSGVYESVFFSAVIFIYSVIYGMNTDKAALYYVAVIVFTLAYIWLSAIVRTCYSSLWLNRNRLEMTEQRCVQLSRRDDLTGLLNKSGLSAKFEDMLSQKMYNGENRTLSVVLMDIDNFRKYNHIYGYDRSDDCLSRLCNCIKIVAKPYTELVSRFGGDEFVFLFENMDEIEVVKFAEQLRRAVETMAVPFGEGIVTVSLGVSGASRLVGSVTYSELLKEADEQLMIAKANGKNCLGFKNRPFINDTRKPAWEG